MKLDDLKTMINKEDDIMDELKTPSIDKLTSDVATFNDEVRRGSLIETGVAMFALLSVLAMLGFGDQFYQLVISQIFPELIIDDLPSMNMAMYLSLVLMAIYCLFVPIKLSLAQRSDDSLGWTLTSRISAEIAKLEKQNKLWSNAHLWSFAPAIAIGVLFFWGLQVSLTGEWFPNVYLQLYFLFIILSTFGGLWMKKNMTEQRIKPMLEKLYYIRKELKTKI
jgi:hypothetical protein